MLHAIPSSSPSSQPQPENKREHDEFLEILHRLLDESEDSKFGIVAWNEDGLSFRVYDSQRFEHYLMPIYFGSIRASSSTAIHCHHEQILETYDSFLGKLRFYGFRHIFPDGNHIDTFRHPLFVRGEKSMSLRMTPRCHEPISKDSWPMPSLSSSVKNDSIASNSSNTLRRSGSSRTKKTSKPRPCRAIVSILKRKKKNTFQTSERRTVEKRVSFKDAFDSHHQHTFHILRSHLSFLEFLSGDVFDDDETNKVKNEEINDCEPTPLSVSSRYNVSLGDNHRTLENEPNNFDTTPMSFESNHLDNHLDPVYGDSSLQRDIAEALAGI